MKMGFTLNVIVSDSNEKLALLGNLNNFVPSWREALYWGFYKVFTIDYCKYNPPLWFVMPYFYGTIAVYILNGYCCRVKKFGHILLVSIICLLCLSTVNYHMCGSIYGLIIAYYEDKRESLPTIRPRNTIIRLIYYSLIIYFSSINIEATGIWEPLRIFQNTKLITMTRQFGCAFTFYELSNSKQVRHFCSNILWINLGFDSMFIFSYHWLVLLTAGCWLYLRLMDFNCPDIVAGTIIWFVIIVVSSGIHRISIWLSQWVGVNKIINSRYLRRLNNVRRPIENNGKER